MDPAPARPVVLHLSFCLAAAPSGPAVWPCPVAGLGAHVYLLPAFLRPPILPEPCLPLPQRR